MVLTAVKVRHADMSRNIDFQHCGILRSVDSGEPVLTPFKLRKSN